MTTVVALALLVLVFALAVFVAANFANIVGA
jgi:hypothetical protein